MSSSDTSNNVSPIPKKKIRYKMYKENLDIPVPLRTLNRWTAKKNVGNENENSDTFNVENHINDDESYEEDTSESSFDELRDDSTCDERRSDDYHSECSSNEEIIGNEHQGIGDNIELIRSDDNDNHTSMLLYENSNITVDESVYNLLDLYIRHQLSKSALKDALKIQLAALPNDNRMPKTLYKLFQYVENITPQLDATKHFYCKACYFYIGINADDIKKCASCNADQDNFNFYFGFNIEHQLKYYFEKGNLADKLKFLPPSRDKNVISDITDGSEYKRVNAREDRQPYDLTLILNTDGLSLVKSRSSHCWPLMYTIAELPEYIRESFIIILGLWYDSNCKPDMNTFLQPFCIQLKNLYDQSVKWIHPRTKETLMSKIVAPLFIADAPARANLQNILSFNGIFGCNICEISTKKCKKIVGKKTTRMYPFEENPSTLRTSDRMKTQATMQEIFSKPHIRGVKGLSVLSILPLIDLGSCVVPEYMHSVLLGVVKHYVNLLLKKPGPWNIKKNISEIDNFMLNIKPPQSFNRLPRELTNFQHYKASEFYNFILFYSLPGLINYLENKYLQHLMLLVIALFDLLQDKITIQPDLQRAEKLLDLFVKETPSLYSDRDMTYNCHQLRHLGLCVRRWGPLRSISAFPWENENGYIANCVHGTKNMGQEIVNNLKMIQSVQILKSTIAQKNFAEEPRVLENYTLLGSKVTIEMQDNERQLLVAEGFNYENLNIYARAKLYNEIYTSTIYKATKTNSFTVKIINNHDSCIYGMIKFFFRSECQLYFMVQCLVVKHEKMMSHLNTKEAVRHIIPVTESMELLLIKFQDVKNICQLVRVGEYICKRPDQLKKVW